MLFGCDVKHCCPGLDRPETTTTTKQRPGDPRHVAPTGVTGALCYISVERSGDTRWVPCGAALLLYVTQRPGDPRTLVAVIFLVAECCFVAPPVATLRWPP